MRTLNPNGAAAADGQISVGKKLEPNSSQHCYNSRRNLCDNAIKRAYFYITGDRILCVNAVSLIGATRQEVNDDIMSLSWSERDEKIVLKHLPWVLCVSGCRRDAQCRKDRTNGG